MNNINKMTDADRYNYVKNKYLYGLTNDIQEQMELQKANEYLRQKYGIANDEYSFEHINSYSNPATMIKDNVDYNTYITNKARWNEISDKNSPEAKALQAENEQIRQKWGVLGDNYNAGGLQRYNNSQYGNDVERIPNYKKYLEALDEASAVANMEQKKSDELLKRIDTFEYNPNTDVNYQTYKKEYEDLGENAYKNAVAKNNETTSGRSNTFANTAAANALLAYKNKVTQAIPQFSQDAYNRLFQNYQASLQNTQNAYNNMRDIADMYGRASEFQYGINRNAMNDRMIYNDKVRGWREADMNFDYMSKANPINLGILGEQYRGQANENDYNEQYGYPQKAMSGNLSNEGLALSNEGKRLENMWYPQKTQVEINKLNSQINKNNASANKNNNTIISRPATQHSGSSIINDFKKKKVAPTINLFE